MLLSDEVGAIAGILLAIPPLHDQWGRLKERQQEHADHTTVPVTRRILLRSMRAKRDNFNGWDTMLLALGAIGILMSFGLKLFDL